MRKRDTPDGAALTIVGIGASAGGLEAFTQLLKNLPLDTGMAFVLVQHLDPAHESALAQILSRATSLPVSDIRHRQRVQPNRVYVIPRDKDLSIERGVLKLQPRQRIAPHRPIDSFFESLAQDQGNHAIGVVLSGTATDGTLGLEAIKAEGGITFAQDESAKHDSMPRSAIAAGCVDLILSPADIAKELARIAKHPSAPKASPGPPTPGKLRSKATAPGTKPTRRDRKSSSAAAVREKDDGETSDRYNTILLLLRSHSGVDFSLYKSTTIQRRIHRRMILTQHDTPAKYADFLRGNAKELDALYADVLIGVTSFFRNPETFDALQRKVLPELLKKRGNDPLRCWVLGCSTGQEAYSIAITFLEAVANAPRTRKLQIFATDLNEALLDKARRGVYARTLVEGVTPERLSRYFVEEEGGYRVSKTLREMIVFARQNLISDPPFSRLDLVSCRNVLIYLEPGLQRRALPSLYYALKPEGFLLLGASESIGGFTDLFEPVDKKHKIFSKKLSASPALHLPVETDRGERDAPATRPEPARRRGPAEPTEGVQGELDAQRDADRITINQFAPPGVLINDALHILQFRGQTGAYLESPAGKATFDVLKMARDGLMLPLRDAIHQARKENKTALKENVRVQGDVEGRKVNLRVIPLKNLRERCYLILFEARQETGRASARRARPVETPTRGSSRARVAALENDLAESREYLQSTQEQHEAAREELQAANEEVQSANEELQSVNEELETSKEELESANEELTTLNEEMSSRNVELNRLNNDLVNFQAATRLAIVLVGRDRKIRRFSPEAEGPFELRATDIGRPIEHTRHKLVSPHAGSGETRSQSTPRHPDPPVELERIVADVIANVRAHECDVRDKSGRWHSLRVRPYMTLDNKVDGAVLVLVDIDVMKRGEQAFLESAERRWKTIFESVAVSLWEEDFTEVQSAIDGLKARGVTDFARYFAEHPEFVAKAAESIRVLNVNDATVEMFQAREKSELLGPLPPIFFPESMPIFANELVALAEGRTYFESEALLKTLRGTPIYVVFTMVLPAAGQPSDRILFSVTDITERRRMEEQIKLQAEQLAEESRRKDEFLAMLGHELRNPLAPIRSAVHLLRMHEGGDEPTLERQAHRIIERQVANLTKMVNDLLEVSRFVSRRLHLDLEPVELNEILHSAIETVRPLLEHREHELVTSLFPEPVWIQGDTTRLEEVFVNLLDNAVKYTPDRGRIEIATEQPRGDNRVTVRVRDSGPGIDGELLPRIFDLFTQADQSLDRSGGGLGIGLSLARQLVDLHGGTIEAHSPPEDADTGSEFVVKLQRIAAPAKERPEPPSAPARLAHDGIRVLVVDDNVDQVTLLSIFLREKGFSVQACHTGPEGLQVARDWRPDIALLDIGLPGMDGYALARQLRRDATSGSSRTRLRLIALSGYGRGSDVALAREAGFDGHLIKPFSFEELESLMNPATTMGS